MMRASRDSGSHDRRARTIRRRRIRLAWALIGSLAGWGCNDQVTAPREDESSKSALGAGPALSVADDVSGVVLHVTGRGIVEPMVIALGAPDSLGRTQAVDVMLPAGPDRVFRAYAYTRHVLTHEASDTADVTRANLQVALDLPKYPGSSPSTRAPSDFIVRIDDAETFSADTDSTSVAPGDQIFLSVKVTAGSSLASLGALEGDPLPDIGVSWGVEGSDVLQFSDWICVTGSTGTCSIRVFVSPQAEAGTRVPVFASTAGIADQIIVSIQ